VATGVVPAGGTNLTFSPAADAYVDAANSGTNFGRSQIVRTISSPEQRTYLRFNVAGVAGRPITRAILRLYANGSAPTGFQVQKVSNDLWSETGITYNNKPAIDGAVVTAPAHAYGAWVSVDVTSYIRGDDIYSLALLTGSTKPVSYPSREAPGNRPELIITVGSAAPILPPTTLPSATLPPPTATRPPATATRVSPTNVPPPTATRVSPTNVPPPTATATPVLVSAARTLTFRPAADVFVDSAKANTNNGQSTILRTLARPEQRSYLRFNVNGVNGQPVTRALLRVFANGSSTVGFQVQRVSNNIWDENSVTYNNKPALDGVVANSGAHGHSQWVTVDITSLITGDGIFSLAMTTTSTKAVSYPSDEANSNRPQLIVEAGQAPAVSLALAVPTNVAPTNAPPAGVLPTNPPPTQGPPTQVLPTNAPPALVTPTDTPPAATNLPPATSTTFAPGAPATLTFVPAADAYVDASSRHENFGAADFVQTVRSPEQRAYLRFNVYGVDGRPVTRALLRLYATGSSEAGLLIAKVSDNLWSETDVTYHNQPDLTGEIGTSGSHNQGVWVTVDVTSYITGDGIFSLAMLTQGRALLAYPSREADANQPELVLTVGGS
jgi:hypothetical protein